MNPVAGQEQQDLVARRRAVEALRSGVPSWDAVAVLGSGQPEAEDRFTALLESVGELRRPTAGPSGLLLGGGFGAGKSHLLTHMAHLAMRSRGSARVIRSDQGAIKLLPPSGA